MDRKSIAYFILLAGVALGAQSINISGKVTGKTSGNPVSNATVTLAGKNMSDETDVNGAYSIITSALTASTPKVPVSESITLNNGIISINLPTSASLKIELYDLQGKLLDKPINRPEGAGEYRFNLAADPRAVKMMVVRVSTGRNTSFFRYFPGNCGKRMSATSLSTLSSGGERLTRVQAIIDTLKVTASGYTPAAVTISSYEGSVDIALDSVALDKFSFFVTSLKALQELSGSENGFGGDLRFGKTGPGAGLLGADSICQCIAEKSMPNSKVKQWRAFLSVAKGPEGTQVNAIDRIGKGPWYDRMGRILSSNITELLNTRPAGADPAIKNDLPNEDGIPNHKPDGKEVDNHHFITGSKTDGTLYDPTSTCADWTTTDSNAIAGRPRCGFTWPRGSGTFHWISGLNVHGCGAGIQITEVNGGVGAVIGAGGGYGGFYCFALTP